METVFGDEIPGVLTAGVGAGVAARAFAINAVFLLFSFFPEPAWADFL